MKYGGIYLIQDKISKIFKKEIPQNRNINILEKSKHLKI